MDWEAFRINRQTDREREIARDQMWWVPRAVAGEKAVRKPMRPEDILAPDWEPKIRGTK